MKVKGVGRPLQFTFHHFCNFRKEERERVLERESEKFHKIERIFKGICEEIV